MKEQLVWKAKSRVSHRQVRHQGLYTSEDEER